MAVEGEKSVAQTARDLGINENTLHTWIGKYHRKSATVASVVDQQHLYDELAELRKENKRLKEERAILKRPLRTLRAKRCEVRFCEKSSI